ncbi:MAG: DUF1003 domain-containing protein [Myxococcaceae bacterium]
MNKVTCFISKKNVDVQEAKKAENLQPDLLLLIQRDYPDFDKDAWISIEALNKYRKLYLVNLIIGEQGDLGRLEAEAIDSIANNRILSENIEEDIEEKLTLGQRMADRIAAFGGSWAFISIFFVFIGIWLLINSIFRAAFDPYPYILLNLILSCVAAIQAPIIMMSQNRQEQKDRLRSEHDYKINLKAELEIKMLHEKMDHLMINQNSRLLEIQQIQAEYLEDILDKLESRH